MRGSHISRLILCSAMLFANAAALAEDPPHDPRRGGTLIDEIAPAPPSAKNENDDRKRLRNYPEQPPTIPHSVDGYEISLRGNKCLACHSRRRSAETGAPMAGVSHFRGRDLQVRAEISPARYFCLQCHVPQTSASPPTGNDFIDGADLPAEN